MGEPIPSENSTMRTCKIISVCLILYLIVVSLINSSCTVPFLPEYAVCMRSNYEETEIALNDWKLLIMIPFTIIIATNILFDYDDIPIFSFKSPRFSSQTCHPNPILEEVPFKKSKSLSFINNRQNCHPPLKTSKSLSNSFLNINNSQNCHPILEVVPLKTSKSHLILEEAPFRTSKISALFIVVLIFGKCISNIFYGKLIDFGILLAIFLIKGPLIAIWTNHQQKQKSLKRNQHKMDAHFEASSLSAQAKHSQLESYVLNELNR